MTTPEAATPLKNSVATAVEQLRGAFADHELRVVPDGQGGAWFEILDIDLGSTYEPARTFVVGLLPFTLPASDIYPLFIRADLTRCDGRPLGDAFQVTTLSWPGEPTARPVVQVSRRTRNNFTAQTAAQKVGKVLHWVCEQ